MSTTPIRFNLEDRTILCKFEGEWETLLQVGGTVWSGTSNAYQKTKRYRAYVTTAMEQIVHAVNAYDALREENAALREALEAIMARLDGVFDHPSLVKQGPLAETSIMDVRRFTKAVLTKEKRK